MNLVLRQARLERGLTQSDLARLAGIDAATVSHLEYGKTSTCRARKSAVSLAAILNLSPEDVLQVLAERPIDRLRRRYKIDPISECWLWTGARNREGYGVIQDGSRQKRAHRFSWELHRGAIPAGLLVCHSCDTPACVNPAHLFLGTDLDNAKDRDRKGRQARLSRADRQTLSERFAGEGNPSHRLSAYQAKTIKSLHREGHSQKHLACAFGVSQGCIADVVHGRTWGGVA